MARLSVRLYGDPILRTVAEPVISKLPGQHGSLSAEEQLIPFLLHRPG